MKKIAVTVLATLIATVSGILLFVTVADLFTHCRCGSPGSACMANLRQIDGAVATWALENKKTTNDLPTWADICPEYLRDEPKCPEAKGVGYVLTHVDQHALCSIREHSFRFHMAYWGRRGASASTNSPAQSASR